jgi:hypothetical protein
MDLLRREQPDACILNIRLGPDMVYPLADQLLAGFHLFSLAPSIGLAFPIALQRFRCTLSP